MRNLTKALTGSVFGLAAAVLIPATASVAQATDCTAPYTPGDPLSSDCLTERNIPHFSAIWLEPAVLSGGGMATAPTEEELGEIFVEYANLGIETIIVSAVDLNGDVFFEVPSQATADTTDPDWGTFKATVKDDSVSPAVDHSNQWIFFDKLFEVADENEMKVIIGLPRGDQLSPNESGVVAWSSLIEMAKQTAYEFNYRYNNTIDSPGTFSYDYTLAGWYLPFESSCLGFLADYNERAMDAVESQVQDHAKRFIISPPERFDNCGYSESHTSLDELLTDLDIDIYMPQDGMGAGYIANTNFLPRGVNGLGEPTFDLPDAAYWYETDIDNSGEQSVRKWRIAQNWTSNSKPYGQSSWNEEYFNEVMIQNATAIANANTTETTLIREMWINVEAWNMDGICNESNDIDTTSVAAIYRENNNLDVHKYGCAYGTDFMTIGREQLETHWDGMKALNPSSRPRLMLNEGFLLSDFSYADQNAPTLNLSPYNNTDDYAGLSVQAKDVQTRAKNYMYLYRQYLTGAMQAYSPSSPRP